MIRFLTSSMYVGTTMYIGKRCIFACVVSLNGMNSQRSNTYGALDKTLTNDLVAYMMASTRINSQLTLVYFILYTLHNTSLLCAIILHATLW